MVTRRQTPQLPICRRSDPALRRACRHEAAIRRDRSRRPGNSAGCGRRCRQRADLASSPPPTSTSTNSTGRPILRSSRTSPPHRPAKTTGGVAKLYTSHLLSWPARGPCRSHQRHRSTPRAPDRCPSLVARRLADRLHRRSHVRPGLDRRRHLSNALLRRRSQGRHSGSQCESRVVRWLDEHQLGIAEIKGGSSHLFVYDISTQQESSGAQPHPPRHRRRRRARNARLRLEHQQHRLHPQLVFASHPRSGPAL